MVCVDPVMDAMMTVVYFPLPTVPVSVPGIAPPFMMWATARSAPASATYKACSFSTVRLASSIWLDDSPISPAASTEMIAAKRTTPIKTIPPWSVFMRASAPVVGSHNSESRKVSH